MEKQQISQIEKRKLIHAGGRETNVEIKNKERIGTGFYGDVYRSDISIVDDEERLRTLRNKFAIKEFKDYSKADLAERALKIHEALKSAGVETWSTYRRIKNEKSILMTDGERGDTMIISTTDASKSKNILRNESLNRIEGFEQAIENAIKNALLAGGSGISLPPDSWFANFKKLPEKKKMFLQFRAKDRAAELINLFVGDFDCVSTKDIKSANDLLFEVVPILDHEEIKFKNLVYLKMFVDALLEQIMEGGKEKKYRKVANESIGINAIEIERGIGRVGRWKRFLKQPIQGEDYDDKYHHTFREN